LLKLQIKLKEQSAATFLSFYTEVVFINIIYCNYCVTYV